MGRPGGSQETWPGAAVLSASTKKSPPRLGRDAGDGFRKLAFESVQKKREMGLAMGMGPHPMYFLIFANISSAKVHIFSRVQMWGDCVGMSFWVITKSSFFKMICWSSPRTAGDRKLDL